MMKLFLLVAGVFLFPVALSYGVDPAATLPKFMNFTVEGTDQTHIFRALMGLYLGMVTFCIIAAFTPEWQHVAVVWAVFFAYSLAIGQILSLIVDGMQAPSSCSTWRSNSPWARLGFWCSAASGAKAECISPKDVAPHYSGGATKPRAPQRSVRQAARAEHKGCCLTNACEAAPHF